MKMRQSEMEIYDLKLRICEGAISLNRTRRMRMCRIKRTFRSLSKTEQPPTHTCMLAQKHSVCMTVIHAGSLPVYNRHFEQFKYLVSH